jgi:hypothetical protein
VREKVDDNGKSFERLNSSEGGEREGEIKKGTKSFLTESKIENNSLIRITR